MIKQKKEKYITVEEMNELLIWADQHLKVVRGEWRPHHPEGTVWSCAFIQEYIVEIRATVAGWNGYDKACTYIARKDGRVDIQQSPLGAFQKFQRIYKMPDFRQPGYEKMQEFLGGSVLKNGKESFRRGAGLGIQFASKKHSGRWINDVHYYDMNKAYASVLAGDYIPDTTHYVMQKDVPDVLYVKEGQIGFLADMHLSICPPGDYADIVFDLMPNPYKKYILELQDRLAKATTEEEKTKLKRIPNLAVCYYQKSNPFIRAFVVHTAEERIKKYWSDQIIYSYVDSLVSLSEIPDIPVGTGIGQFKHKVDDIFIEGPGQVKLRHEVARIKGIPQAAQPIDYDPAVDKKPDKKNLPMTMNWNSLQIELNNEYISQNRPRDIEGFWNKFEEKLKRRAGQCISSTES